MVFAWTVLVVVAAAIAVLLAYTVRTGISPVPTTPRVARAMVDLVPADNEGSIYELGSGWGNLAARFARAFPERRVVACELSPLPYLVSRIRQALFPRPNLTIRRGDFLRLGLADAGLVCCYLYPRGMRRLRTKFEAELRPGAVVVSNSFEVPGWVPVRAVAAEDQYATPVYLYALPASARAGAAR